MSLKVDISKRLGEFLLQAQFEVQEEKLALLGASGSGKSVTLRCIAGILRPDQGRIELDGKVLFDSAAGIDLPPQQRDVGYLFQQYALFPHMTVGQNIAVAVRERKCRKALTQEKLQQFRLLDVAEKLPHQLSGGQQQRVALARILASQPRAVLLDEPFSALDSYLKQQLELDLQDLLAQFPGPVLWVTHDRGEAFRNCSRVCVMADGRAEPVLPMDALLHDPGTEAAARISGCKNLLPARGEGQWIWIPDWDLRLFCGKELSPDTRIAGLRAHHVLPAAEGAENGFYCHVERVVEDVFETIVLLRPERARPQAPLLRMQLSKELWARQRDPAGLWVAIAPEQILPLA